MSDQKEIPKPDRRYVNVTGEITEEKSEKILNRLIELEGKDPSSDILVVIDSYGGDIDAMWTIINTMAMIRCPIATLCVGKAMSAASLILISGDKGKRFCSKQCRIMFHQLSGFTSGKIEDMDVRVQEAKRLQGELEHFISSKTKIKLNEVRKKMKNDFFLTSEEAIKLGVVDKIINNFSEMDIKNW